jgi:hypothetical protein
MNGGLVGMESTSMKDQERVILCSETAFLTSNQKDLTIHCLKMYLLEIGLLRKLR